MISDKIAFVILTWNSASYIEACLHSVLSLSADNLHIYIADNGSSDDTCRILKSFEESEPDRISVTCFPKNDGTTVPRNRLIRQIPGDTKFICVLDSDTVINQSAAEALIAALSGRPSAMLAAPRMWKPGNEEQLSCKHFPTVTGKLMKGIPIKSIQRRGLKRESYPFFPDPNTEGSPPVSADKNIYSVDYAISACWMLKNEVLEKVGLLDEHYFYAPEDVDYCAMIWEKGCEVIFVSGASIYHNTQRISHKKLISKANKVHIQGLFYYFRKHRYCFKAHMRNKSVS